MLTQILINFDNCQINQNQKSKIKSLPKSIGKFKSKQSLQHSKH